MAVDPDLGATHGRERREPSHRWRLRERCTEVEAVLEVRSGGVVALGQRNKGAGGEKKKRRYIWGTFSPG
jgi:hypothetical protein